MNRLVARNVHELLVKAPAPMTVREIFQAINWWTEATIIEAVGALAADRKIRIYSEKPGQMLCYGVPL